MDFQLSMLFEKQRILDSIIYENKNVSDSYLTIKKLVALDVEVSELANEWQEFKYWKTNPVPKPGVLEEYVDGLHFVLSIGLDIDFYYEDWEIKSVPCCDGVSIQLLEIKSVIIDIYKRRNRLIQGDLFLKLLELYIGLSEMLNFTWDEVVKAYLIKNQINHDRQNNGY